MQTLLDFLVNNYLWFLIISLILVFALIGYFVDSREKQASKIHFAENENAFLEDENIKDVSLKDMIDNNKKEANNEEAQQDEVGEQSESASQEDEELQ